MQNINHKRNTDGLKAHAENKRKECLKRFNLAIQSLLREGNSINFNSVSKKSGLSTAWLYRNKEVRQKIEILRKEQVRSKKVEYSLKEESKNAVIIALKNRVKLQEKEIKELKNQIEVLYGQITLLERSGRSIE